MEARLFICHFLICILDVEKVYLLLRFIIGFPEKTNLRKSILAVFICGVSIAVLIKFMDPKYIATFHILIAVLAMSVMSKVHNIQRVLMVFIAFLCVSEIDFFIGAVVGLLSDTDASIVNMNSIGNSCISLCVIAAVSMLCRYFDVAFYKGDVGHSKCFIAVETAILLVNLLIMGTVFDSLSHAKTDSANVLLIATMSLSMLISVISLIFYAAVHNANEYKKLNCMNEELLRVQREYFSYEKILNQHLRRFRHDFNNHISILKGMMDTGNSEQAGRYLENLIKRAEAFQPAVQCGNDTINIVLNQKYRIAAAENIILQVEGKVPSVLTVNDFELCTVLTNGVDNAIEACRHLKSSAKHVQIRLSVFQEYLRIEIQNPIEGPISLHTSKNSKMDHGFGLYNIKESVEINRGNMEIRVDKSMFVLDIILRACENNQ